jgi:hypothetical protein
MTLPILRKDAGDEFSRIPLACLLLFLCLVAAACKSPGTHTSNPQLKGIDAMLSAQLPPGTPSARVVNFIHVRGYEQRDSVEPHTLVVIVNHVNPETLQPEAARVTFRFDAADKLLTYDLQPAATLPMR